MHITEKTKEYECCITCKHNIRKSDEKGIYCECEIDKHYIGYIECFDSVCERWKKNNMDYETLRNSMTVQDAARVLRDTNCYGTMDIAKNVILKALEGQMSSSEKPNKWILTSERLPEKDVEVLATTEWGAITIAERCSENEWFIYEGDTTANADEIKAWMPLPLPYKAESEE
jgi:hypothetical protein